MFLDVIEVAIGPSPLPGGGKILEIVLQVPGGKLDALEGKGLEIFLWNKPGFVGAINAAREKERLVMISLQLPRYPVRDEAVARKLWDMSAELTGVSFLTS